MHEMIPCSGHIMHVRDEDCDDILSKNRIVDVHSSQTLGISMPSVCRNGCSMIAFITEIQEQTGNRG